VIGARANAALAAYGAKIGPESGFDRHLHHWRNSPTLQRHVLRRRANAYHTLKSMKFMRRRARSLTRHALTPPEFVRASRVGPRVLSLKQKLKLNSGCANESAQVQAKEYNRLFVERLPRFRYRRRHLQHVLIGSEGTLAFIAEAVLNTVPDLP